MSACIQGPALQRFYFLVSAHQVEFTLAVDIRRSVYRVFFNASLCDYICISTCLCPDIGISDGIAFDWINRRIYYSDYTNQTINSVAEDGSKRAVIARVSKPRAIVLDPCRGYDMVFSIYLFDWGEVGTRNYFMCINNNIYELADKQISVIFFFNLPWLRTSMEWCTLEFLTSWWIFAMKECGKVFKGFLVVN